MPSRVVIQDTYPYMRNVSEESFEWSKVNQAIDDTMMTLPGLKLRGGIPILNQDLGHSITTGYTDYTPEQLSGRGVSQPIQNEPSRWRWVLGANVIFFAVIAIGIWLSRARKRLAK